MKERAVGKRIEGGIYSNNEKCDSFIERIYIKRFTCNISLFSSDVSNRSATTTTTTSSTTTAARPHATTHSKQFEASIYFARNPRYDRSTDSLFAERNEDT